MKRIINEKSTENEIGINRYMDLEHRLISFQNANSMTHQVEETMRLKMESYAKRITDLEMMLREKEDESQS